MRLHRSRAWNRDLGACALLQTYSRRNLEGNEGISQGKRNEQSKDAFPCGVLWWSDTQGLWACIRIKRCSPWRSSDFYLWQINQPFAAPSCSKGASVTSLASLGNAMPIGQEQKSIGNCKYELFAKALASVEGDGHLTLNVDLDRHQEHLQILILIHCPRNCFYFYFVLFENVTLDYCYD